MSKVKTKKPKDQEKVVKKNGNHREVKSVNLGIDFNFLGCSPIKRSKRKYSKKPAHKPVERKPSKNSGNLMDPVLLMDRCVTKFDIRTVEELENAESNEKCEDMDYVKKEKTKRKSKRK